MSKRRQAGFTLVEIAIVLVIVGLLLGGVLKGQELIFNSKVKATYNLSKELSAAFNGYQDRYKVFPGDDGNATGRFPTAAATNGNADGFIAWGGDCRPGEQGGENCNSLHHMRLSGFLSGSGRDGVATPFGGTASVAGAGVFMPNAGSAPVLGIAPWGMTHKIASSIDTSFDDGNSATGSMRCRNLAAYDMAAPDTTLPDWCSIQM